jgi:hypothetical protein
METVTAVAHSDVPTEAPETPWQRYRTPALVILLSTVIYGGQLVNPVYGDIELYRTVGLKVLHGQPLYGNPPLEYPPYIVVWWILPALAGDLWGYRVLFGLELMAIDIGVKALLYAEGRRVFRGAKAYLPLLIFSAAGLFQIYVYLKRFDLIPAAMTFVGAVLFARRWPLASGLLFALAIGTKVYPLVLLPFLAVLAVREGTLARWLAGGVLGLLPLALLSRSMPWWRFQEMHAVRGLQVESLYAGFLWLAHRVGGLSVEWVHRPAGTELHGPVANTWLHLGRGLWIVAVVVSAIVSVRRAMHGPGDVGRMARLALLPLLGFIAFNFVLSPQYLMWMGGFLALASLEGWDWPLSVLFAAVAAAPSSYPAISYFSGYDLQHAVALCVRNTLLVTAWVGLLLAPEPGTKRAAVEG